MGQCSSPWILIDGRRADSREYPFGKVLETFFSYEMTRIKMWKFEGSRLSMMKSLLGFVHHHSCSHPSLPGIFLWGKKAFKLSLSSGLLPTKKIYIREGSLLMETVRHTHSLESTFIQPLFFFSLKSSSIRMRLVQIGCEAIVTIYIFKRKRIVATPLYTTTKTRIDPLALMNKWWLYRIAHHTTSF